MASYETSRAAPFGAISIFRAVQTVSEARANLAAWNNGRKTRKALNALSNCELDDIGLCRADIDMIGR